VIVAPVRGARPGARPARAPATTPHWDPSCPFCPGNEDQTPPEIVRFPAGDQPWRLRVIPNKYPAVAAPVNLDASPEPEELGRIAAGVHEVIIETPDHAARFHRLDSGTLMEVWRAYRSRFAAAVENPLVRQVILFRNQGPLANATLEHPHAQLVGLPFAAPQTEAALEHSLRHRAEETRPLLLAQAELELEAGTRLVGEGRDLLAYVPYAPSFDYEIWVVPRAMPPRFDRVGDALLEETARLVGRCLRALAAALGEPDYNLILQAPPLVAEAEEVLPWYGRIIPRISGTAGFEIGAGIRILTVDPETAAMRLRDALQ
jgi:UDPglucose--hexose-1-phosphate uridylyltransferase